MANKPKDFDNVNPWSDFKPLPPDGYVCTILNAKEETSKKGNQMIVVFIDIAEGEYANYFRDLWKKRKEDSDNPSGVKYPFDGRAYVTFEYEGKTTKKFKALCTAVEEDGKTLMWNEKFAESMIGANIGVIFRKEETRGYGDNEDKTYWNCKPFAFRSAKTIREGNFSVPEDKPLKEETTASYAEPEGFSALSDEMIPF